MLATARFDVVIRGGTLADGSGRALYEGDVALCGDRIAALGSFAGSGVEEIDAKGMLVTPGFIDVHTHLDGQVTWAEDVSPASHHGVTTVLMGNCGVGFAPCRPADRKMMLELMEGVEDIPEAVMEEGIPWNWETFPEYLEALEQRRSDADFGAMIPHGPVRINVMGRRGYDREPATANDAAQMAALVKEAVAAGAFGFSTTRSLNNRYKDGSLAPTITAREDELRAMACAMGELGRGIIEINIQWMDLTPEGSAEFDLLKRVVKASGRPTSFAVLQENAIKDKWQWVLRLIEEANAEGIPIRAQILPRPIGILVGWELSLNPFMFCSTWKSLENLPREAKLRSLRDPVVRARLLSEEPVTRNPLYLWLARTVENMVEFGDPPNYSPPASALLAERAKRERKTPLELAYDLMLDREGTNMLFHPVVNFSDHTLDHIPAMLRNEHAYIGLSDAGAHVGILCDASVPTHLLTYWTRDRQGERLAVPEAVRMLTSHNARFLGLSDRGRLEPGLKADINVIDYERLTLHAPHTVDDLPGGARRLLQRADGYAATVKSGEITYRNGCATGRKPGRLLRAG